MHHRKESRAKLNLPRAAMANLLNCLFSKVSRDISVAGKIRIHVVCKHGALWGERLVSTSMNEHRGVMAGGDPNNLVRDMDNLISLLLGNHQPHGPG